MNKKWNTEAEARVQKFWAPLPITINSINLRKRHLSPVTVLLTQLVFSMKRNVQSGRCSLDFWLTTGRFADPV